MRLAVTNPLANLATGLIKTVKCKKYYRPTA
jgi:hypothetical protein